MSLMLQTMRDSGGNCSLIDIGGNIGFYTLAAARAGFWVDVFEPVPLNAAMIGASLERNRFKNVRLHTSALGDGTHVELGMGRSSNNQGGVKHEGGTTSSTMLPSLRFDDIPSFSRKRGGTFYLKIDIEGGECSALRGMKDFISRVRIVGVNMEWVNAKKCCKELSSDGQVFHMFWKRHGLCPQGTTFESLCSYPHWDLVWKSCSKTRQAYTVGRGGNVG